METEPNNDIPKGMLTLFPNEAEQAQSGFTSEIIKEIYISLKMGMTLADCANLIQFPVNRLDTWYRENYYGFAVMVNLCIVSNKKLHVGRLTTSTDALKVKTAQWFLERKHKDEYTKETIINVNHVMIDNVANTVAETLIKFIQDPQQLKLAMQELKTNLGQLQPQINDTMLTAATVQGE